MARNSADDRATHRPRYHASDENTDADSAREPLTARQRRMRLLMIFLVIALGLVFVVLHVTGVLGPGTNG